MLSHPSSMTENDGKLRKLGRHGPYCILLHSACEVRHDVQHNYSRFSTDLWQPQLGAYRVNSMDCGLTNVSPALIPEFLLSTHYQCAIVHVVRPSNSKGIRFHSLDLHALPPEIHNALAFLR